MDLMSALAAAACGAARGAGNVQAEVTGPAKQSSAVEAGLVGGEGAAAAAGAGSGGERDTAPNTGPAWPGSL